MFRNCFIAFLCSAAMLSIADNNISNPVSGALSGESKERTETLYQIRGYRSLIVSSLLDILKKDWINSYHGSTHIAIELLGEFRERTAVAILVKNVTWGIPVDHFPVGKSMPPLACYICAIALVNIGGLEVRDAVIREIPLRAKEPNALILVAWILNEIEGSSAARALLEDKVKGVQGEDAKNAFRKVLQCYEQEDICQFLEAQPRRNK